MNSSIAPTTHHPKGPSKFPAWARCPKWEGTKDIEAADLEALLPESKRADTEAKDRGTAMHEALAKALLRQPLPFEGLGEGEIEQVQWVAEQVVEIAGRAGYDTSEVAVESRINFYGPEMNFEPMFFGTMDVDFAHIIIDAKFGDMHDYFAQMAGYALAKMERDGHERIEAIVAFARFKRIVRYIITRQTAEAVVFGILNRVESPHAKPNPCEFCGWCNRKATCEAINVVVDQSLLALRDDWGFRLPTASLKEAGSDPVLIGAMKFLWKTYIEPWGKALDYHADIMASTGNVPLGFRKQDERGRLDMKDGISVIEALKELLPAEEITAAATFSMESLAQAYVDYHGGSKDKAKAVIETALVKAGAAARGPANFKLIRKKEAEDDVRAALARPALPLTLPEQATSLPEQQQGENKTP